MLSKYLLLASAYALLARAQNSIPIATSPIVVTTTVPTVVESLSTSLSVSTSTSNADTVVTATATDSSGSTVLVISTAVGGGAQARFLVTVTNIETTQVSTDTVVVSTIGSTTIFGPDTASTSEVPTSTTPPTSSSQPGPTFSPITSLSTSSTPSSSFSRTPTSTFAIATPSTSHSSSSSSTKSPALSTGAKAGIASACIVAFILVGLGVAFLYRKRLARENDPYMPSASEKKRNKKGDEFMYDPEDTSYLNTPYKETGAGGARYEMGSTGSNGSGGRGRGADWPIRNMGAGAAELEGRQPGWGRGPHEKG